MFLIHCRTAAPYELSPFGLHSGMFVLTLMKQCLPEQSRKWVPLAKNFKMIGTYAQTELGHGKIYMYFIHVYM
jgi:acyl-CoA oxidase